MTNRDDANAIALEIVRLQLQIADEQLSAGQVAVLAAEIELATEEILEAIRPEFAPDGHDVQPILTESDPYYRDILLEVGYRIGLQWAKCAYEAAKEIGKRGQRVNFRLLKFPHRTK